ncbi:MAG TPA: hypothetical protein VMV20_03300, partial [Chitinophagaceae bacterium]|nr:hypothetical protein [Chitinophagaceae bacterium]
TRAEKIAWFAWKQVSLSRKLMNLVSGRAKNYLIRRMFGPFWGNRKFPQFAEKSFNELWRSKKRKG